MVESIFEISSGQASAFHRRGRQLHVGSGGAAHAARAGSFPVRISTRSHKTERSGGGGHSRRRSVTRRTTCASADVIVYSARDCARRTPSARRRRRLGIPQIERCDLIGQLMSGSRFAVGVSGTHGKTTTTSMLAQVLHERWCSTLPFISAVSWTSSAAARGAAAGDDFIVRGMRIHANASCISSPTIAIITQYRRGSSRLLPRYRSYRIGVFAKYAAPAAGRRLVRGLGRRCARAPRTAQGARCTHAYLRSRAKTAICAP